MNYEEEVTLLGLVFLLIFCLTIWYIGVWYGTI